MNYAIIIDNEIVKQGSASDLWPNTSFVGAPDEEFLVSKSAVQVQTTKEHDTDTQIIASVPIYIENGVVYSVEVQAKPAPVPTPNWASFSAALVSNSDFEKLYAATSVSHPLKSAAIINGFQHAEAGDFERFLKIWDVWKSVSNIPAEALIQFKALAELHHLPKEIVTAL